MARTKRNSSANQTRPDSSQLLMRDRWIPTNSGGSLRDREIEERGENLVRLAREEEVEPNKEFYMQDPLNKNTFFKTFFDPSVEWQTIQEFILTKKIYVRVTKQDQASDSEPSECKPSGPTQSSLF